MADTRPAVGEITQTTAHFANRGDSNIHVPELNLSFRPGDQVSYSRQDTIAIPRADGKVDAILVQGNTVTAPVMINNNGREVQIQAGDTVVKYENDTFAVRDRFTGEIKIALKGGTSMPAMPSTKTVKVNDQIFSNFEKSDVFDMSGAAPRSTAIQLDNASWGARLFVSSSDIGAKTDNARDPIVLSNARQAKLSDKIELPRVVSDFQTNFFTEQKSSGAAQEYRYDASLNKGEITDPFQAAVHDAAEIDPLIKDAKIYKMTAPVATIKQGFDRAITAEYGEGTVRRDMANILVRNEVPAAFAMPVMEDGQKVIVVYEQAARNRYGLHDNPVVAALEHEALAHTGLSDREVIATQQSRRTIPVQSVTPTQITAQIVQDTYSQPTGFEVIDTAQLRDLSPIEMVRPSMKIASQSTFNPTSPTMATQVAPQQQFRPQMDMAPMRAASSPVDMTGPVVTPKDTVQGRNRDVNTIMTSPLFSEVTGIDLRTGNHKVVDIGVGSVP
ncbi:MAG: hypothetical protein KAS92_01080, partial [Candidatus Omnitrophica bacterium]|nr:hypothetical protein [Candidatus Omnitrophota bacterium]